jgi:hypothetical protein
MLVPDFLERHQTAKNKQRKELCVYSLFFSLTNLANLFMSLIKQKCDIKKDCPAKLERTESGTVHPENILEFIYEFNNKKCDI